MAPPPPPPQSSGDEDVQTWTAHVGLGMTVPSTRPFPNPRRKGGSGPQKFVYQKWPEKILPIVNLGFPPIPRGGPFGVCVGGGVSRGCPPPPRPPAVYGHPTTSLPKAPVLGLNWAKDKAGGGMPWGGRMQRP